AAGDLIAEKYNLGYGKSVALFAGLIALITLAHFKFGLNPILAFWSAYVLTRPLGASIGDLMSQPRQIAADADPGTGKGFGLGTTGTSVVFLALILVVVIIMTQQQRRKPAVITEAATAS
ncbi:MAG: putative rane-anchored protein, partial [Ilumatobacteraceae bacterium]|nr:putative rane-anchored protein [Ilumatobacteraceae bacterium]